MNIVLLRAKLKLEEIDKLLGEFPQYLFLSLTGEGCASLSAEQWSRVEILYGEELDREELKKAHQLKWMHLSGDDLRNIPLKELKERKNILISTTPPPNIELLGEFIANAILSFSMNLFSWKEASHFPALIWDCKWKETMLTAKEITLLQYGLNRAGEEIAKRGKGCGMKVWGVQEKRTFHPHCHKTVSINNVHSILPNMDVVVLSFPKEREYHNVFGKGEFDLMKKEALLFVVGNNRAVDEKALVDALDKGKFRGVLIDLDRNTPLSINSKLWKRPNVIITPDISRNEEAAEGMAFQTFRYNMRQYLHGNINDMHHMLKNGKSRL